MNPFDQHLDGMAGFSFSKTFKKIKKAVKKVDKAIGADKIKKALKIDKIEKATDKAILQTAAEIKRSPIAQAALVVGAGIVLGPAAIAMAKGMFGAGAAAGATAATTATSVSMAAKVGSVALKVGTAVAKGAITSKLASLAQGAPKQVQGQLDQAGRAATEAVNQIAADPQFASIINGLRQQGYSDQEIADYWAQSEAYREAAVPQIAQTVYPQAVAAFQQQGYSQQQAQNMAVIASDQVAEDTVTKIQNKMSGADWIKIGLPIAATVLIATMSKS